MPQPALQPLAVLEGVHEQDRARNVQERSGGVLEIGRVPADEPAVEFDEQAARRPGVVRQPPQQRRLPDAARPVHVERERRLRITGQRLPEAPEFLVPADEGPYARSAQSFPHGHHGGSIPLFRQRTAISVVRDLSRTTWLRSGEAVPATPVTRCHSRHSRIPIPPPGRYFAGDPHGGAGSRAPWRLDRATGPSRSGAPRRARSCHLMRPRFPSSG